MVRVVAAILDLAAQRRLVKTITHRGNLIELPPFRCLLLVRSIE